jgi:hypothetical protein
MTDITILQWIIIYLVGFIITLAILKWLNDNDGYFSYEDIAYTTVFSIVWPLTLLLLILGTVIWLIYKFCKWFLEL